MPMPMRREDSFDVACHHYRSAPELFSDGERLHLYALYKQATRGPAPGYNATVPKMALLRGAELAAWRQLAGTSREAARREYISAVEAVEKVGELPAPAPSNLAAPPRRKASFSRMRALGWTEDKRLLETPLDGLEPSDLVSLVNALRDKVQTLRVGHVMKAGELMRYRETMTGGDWSPRYFEVVPGMLRCYKSKTVRDLRLEVPLTAGVAVFPEAQCERRTRRSGTRFLFRLQLSEPIACASRITEIRCSCGTKADLDDWMSAVEASKAFNTGVPPPLAPVTAAAVAAASASVDVDEPRSPKSPPPKKKGDFDSQLLSRTVHRRSRPSLLSTDSSDAQSYGGFVNLIAIIAIVSNSRALLNEWHKIPLIVALNEWWASRGDGARFFGDGGPPGDAVIDPVVPAEIVFSAAAVVACFGAAVLVERVAAQVHRYNGLWHLLRALVVLGSLVLPLRFTQDAPVRPGTHAAILLLACTAMMKLLSYAHTNAELRRQYVRRVAETDDAPKRVRSLAALQRGASFADLGDEAAKQGLLRNPLSPPKPHGVFNSNEYPRNLTVKDMALFVCFPTLVYQTAYPRTARVRKRWLLKRVLELAVVLSVMLLLVTQFVAPTVRATMEPVKKRKLGTLLERLMALAIPTLFVWILMFVALFELWLSIVAELTRFGDRLFYRDWWNARKFDDYWRLWNLPVHNWLVRHVFFPCLNLGLNKTGATAVVFFVSAALHELLVSAPCHLVRLYAFAGMMTQVPLIAVTNVIDERMPSSRAGNVLFWLVFCVVGQPMCLILYFHDTVSKAEGSASLLDLLAPKLRPEL